VLPRVVAARATKASRAFALGAVEDDAGAAVAGDCAAGSARASDAALAVDGDADFAQRPDVDVAPTGVEEDGAPARAAAPAVCDVAEVADPAV
jgi:hypothetical protein